MNSNSEIIPIVEDDMGEGYEEVINPRMTRKEIERERQAHLMERLRQADMKVSQIIRRSTFVNNKRFGRG